MTSDSTATHRPLLDLARQALRWHLDGENLERPGLYPRGSAPQACFVSLKTEPGSRLRGCIGTLSPTKVSLEEEIVGNALAAATRDPRFPPLERRELKQIRISIDLLSPPEAVASPAELDPSSYGVIVRSGERCGVLLPNLDGVSTAARQIEICREKAGISASEEVGLERFTVERFQELP